MAMNVAKFSREVRAEMNKVTWPGIKEVRTLTIMVFILVVFFALYLWLFDIILGGAVRWLIGT